MKRYLFAGSMIAALLAGTVGASAQVTFTGSGIGSTGHTESASATFSIISGNELQIVLTDTSVGNPSYQPGDGLTGVFFNLPGAPLLSALSVTVTAGSHIIDNGDCTITACAGQTVLGGENAYANAGFAGFAPTDNEGVASSGYGNFGQPNFPGANYTPPPSGSTDGIEFALVGSDYVKAAANTAMQDNSLVQTSETILLGNLPGGTTLANIANVQFGYGTSPEFVLGGSCVGCNPTLPPPSVPEPASAAILGLGLLGLGFLARRRRA